MTRPARCTPDEAAAQLRPSDSIGMGLAISQPPAFLHALGRRTDWVDLRIHGGFLAVLTDRFNHPNVHFLSVFFGPLERILRDAGANIGFAAVQGKTVNQRGQALAAVAHPDFRDELLEAAARASGGRSPLDG